MSNILELDQTPSLLQWRLIKLQAVCKGMRGTSSRMSILTCLLVGVFVLWSKTDAKPLFDTASKNAVDLALRDVKENTQPRLGNLVCADAEYPNQMLSIRIEGDNNLVELSPGRNYVTLRISRPLNYEDAQDKNVNAVKFICENRNTGLTDSFTSKIYVSDVNDIEPIFQKGEEAYRTSINEILTEPLPYKIYNNITVVDNDGTFANQVVRAECVSLLLRSSTIPCDDYFSVNAVRLDGGTYRFEVFALQKTYELETYVISLKAVNEPQVPNEWNKVLNSSEQILSITVNDLQNTAPVFDQGALQFDIYEDHRVGTFINVITPISAYDGDIGDPNPIKFSLMVNQQDAFAFDNDLFDLSPSILAPNGRDWSTILILKNSIDREAIVDTSDTLFINIEAKEYDKQNRTGRPTQTSVATITVTVLDINDETPTFVNRSYSVEVPETLGPIPIEQFNEPQQILANIQVDDRDMLPYNIFNVDFISGNEENVFSLDRYNGTGTGDFILYANKSILDFEQRSNNVYTVVLRATDVDKPSLTSTTQITLRVDDVNDNRPQFDPTVYFFNAPEDSPNGTFIGRVSATDLDAGDQIKYILSSGDQDYRFYIDANGNIYLNGTLDYEMRDSYQVSVIAVDEGGLQNQVTVTILVGNIQDVGPTWMRDQYTALLFEESTELNPPTTVNAVNREGGQLQVFYAIDRVTPSELRTYFELNPNSGDLSVIQPVDFKNTDQGSIIVYVTATAGSLSSTARVLITVVDLNNYAPVFQPDFTSTYYVSVSELEAIGTPIYDMSVTDADGPETEAGHVFFSIVRGALYESFKINATSGSISVAARLNAIPIEVYTILVRARDNGDPTKSSTATLSVSIINKNDKPPSFNESIIVTTVKEGSAMGTSITRVFATDPDPTPRLQFTLNPQVANYSKEGRNVNSLINSTNLFSIGPMDGVLRVSGPIVRNDFDSAILRVTVEDLNAEPGYGSQNASIDIRITVLASDRQNIFFETANGQEENPTLIKDYPETNYGATADVQIVSIQAFDPVISQYITTYVEAAGADPDNYFQVQTSGLQQIIGYVRLRRNLDYEELPGGPPKTLETIILAISDDRLRTATATVRITVLDINDNRPEFPTDLYRFQVDELKRYPYTIGFVTATDRDSSSFGQVEYELTGTNNRDFFIYNTESSNQGEIRISENIILDYETRPVYNLQVIARDNPTANISERLRGTIPLSIEITDANDNPPIFEKSLYNFTVVGTTLVGGTFGVLLAKDADKGRNGEVEYFIESSTNDGISYFDIQTILQRSAQVGEKLYFGQFLVSSSLESLADEIKFEMILLARDNAGRTPQLEGRTRVIITVSKGVKDPKPKWDSLLPSRVDIPENSSIGYFVALLTAVPGTDDSGIEYQFVTDGQDEFNKFKLNSTTGRITVAASLDFEQKAIYSLLVLAIDTRNRTLTNQHLLVVHIIDVDDNDPSFLTCQGKTYEIPEVAYVMEEQDPLFVYQVQACDLDRNAYNAMVYSWFYDSEYCNPSTASDFRLNQTTGNIYTKIRLDRETIPEYLLCIKVDKKPQTVGRRKRDMVDDLKARENHDTVLYLKVIVLDVNDNGPKFKPPSIRETVILEFPKVSIAIAEATDLDQAPHNQIIYAIESIDYVFEGKTMSQPAAFSINGNDGTLLIGQYDYSDFVGGYFNVRVKASDIANPNLFDVQTFRIHVTNKVNQIRVVFDEPADSDVGQKATNMINELNALQRSTYEIKKISYHVIDNEQDPSFDRTDVCMVVFRNDKVLMATDAAKDLNMEQEMRIIQKYGARDPGPCEPAKSIYPEGWESYWWVLVAFAIFIFILVLILIVLTIILHRQYKNYMDSRQTYLVPGNYK